LTHGLAVPVQLATEAGGHLVAGFATAPQDPRLAMWSAESYAAVIALYMYDPAALDGLIAVQRDALTGCLTYEGSLRELDREIERSARGGLALSVCFIDLDGFKRSNDDYGHLRGNDILALVGRILRDGVRGSDTVGRYGGDEFIAVLPQTTEREARQLAERVRSRLADTPIASLQLPLTASIGVAQWTPGTSSAELLAAADGALLAAKARQVGVLTVRENELEPGAARLGGSRSVGTPV
jgi:diguanylate cyclase (GGDEF)-like protein